VDRGAAGICCLRAVDEVVEYWPGRCGCSHTIAAQERVAVGALAGGRATGDDRACGRAPCSVSVLPELWRSHAGDAASRDRPEHVRATLAGRDYEPVSASEQSQELKTA
jgi:hypothetical protein